MKIRQILLPILLTLSALLAALPNATAQDTAFTYQGQLLSGGSPANGAFDFRFRLASDPLANNYVGSSFLTNDIPVSNGLFTTTIDFGAGIFNGSNYWLEVDVRPNGTGAYATLSPLQALTPAPYAVFAGGASAAGLVGTIPMTGLSGTYAGAVTLNSPSNNFTGNGGGLSGLDASQLTSGTVPAAALSQAWLIGGNTGANPTNGNFLGTVDNNPLELWAAGGRALRIEPDTNDAPNMIGGSSINYVDPGIVGATIAGGGCVSGNFFLGVGSNHVSAIFGTISGGRINTVAADHGSIGGGFLNSIALYGYDGVIAGGTQNKILEDATEAVIAGGLANQNGGYSASIGGGYGNYALGSYSTIPGGSGNSAVGNYSFAAGLDAVANNDGAFVWSDSSSYSPFSSAISNEFAVRAMGGARFVTGGAGLSVDGGRVALWGSPNFFGGLQTILGADANQLQLQNSTDGNSWSVYDENFNNSGALIFQPNAGTGAYISRVDGSYNQNSDVRLKRDINPLDGVLDRLLQLRPVSYHFRSAPEGSPLTLGLIAQEVEPLFPEVVGERNGIKSLAYSELIPVTVRAIQELNQKVSEKDEEIETLKAKAAKVDSLEKRLTELEQTVQSLAARK